MLLPGCPCCGSTLVCARCEAWCHLTVTNVEPGNATNATAGPATCTAYSLAEFARPTSFPSDPDVYSDYVTQVVYQPSTNATNPILMLKGEYSIQPFAPTGRDAETIDALDAETFDAINESAGRVVETFEATYESGGETFTEIFEKRVRGMVGFNVTCVPAGYQYQNSCTTWATTTVRTILLTANASLTGDLVGRTVADPSWRFDGQPLLVPRLTYNESRGLSVPLSDVCGNPKFPAVCTQTEAPAVLHGLAGATVSVSLGGGVVIELADGTTKTYPWTCVARDAFGGGVYRMTNIAAGTTGDVRDGTFDYEPIEEYEQRELEIDNPYLTIPASRSIPPLKWRIADPTATQAGCTIRWAGMTVSTTANAAGIAFGSAEYPAGLRDIGPIYDFEELDVADYELCVVRWSSLLLAITPQTGSTALTSNQCRSNSLRFNVHTIVRGTQMQNGGACYAYRTWSVTQANPTAQPTVTNTANLVVYVSNGNALFCTASQMHPEMGNAPTATIP